MRSAWLVAVVLGVCVAVSVADVQSSLRISEIMPSPHEATDTEKGRRLDGFEYVELHNIGDLELSLADVNLADGVKYTFPADAKIAAGGYVVVAENPAAFAFRYGVSTPYGPYDGHLSKGGEVLTLRHGTTVVHSFTFQEWFPEVSDRGISYVINDPTTELAAWSNEASWHVSEPGGSPGSEGRSGGIVTYSPASSIVLFTGSLQIAFGVRGTKPGVTHRIVYTTDRTQPTTSSTPYSSTLTITQSTQYRAMLVIDEQPGLVFARTFIAYDSTLRNFQVNNVPIAIVESFGVDVNPNDDIWKHVYFVLFEPPSGTNLLNNAAITLHTMGELKTRGSSSAGNPKKPFSIKFYDDDLRNRNLQPLGMAAEFNFALYGASKWDRTRGVRNCFAYHASREWMGWWAPHTKFFEMLLSIDHGPFGTDNYQGIYVLTETVKRDKNRVNVDGLYPEDTTMPAISGGYIIKNDRSSPEGGDTFDAGGGSFVIDEPSPKTINAQQKQYLVDWWNGFADVLGRAKDPNVITSPWMDSLDVAQTIDFHMLQYLAKNADVFAFSTFLYKPRDPVNGTAVFTWGPQWDYDRSMGCNDDGRCDDPEADQPQLFSAQHITMMFADPQFNRRYMARYHQLRSTTFTKANIASVMRGLAANISASFQREVDKWEFPVVLADAVEAMITWINMRLDYMDTRMCFGTTPPCEDDDYCTTAVCHPQSGACTNVPHECPWPQCKLQSNNGDTCSSTTDFCGIQGGTCTSGQPRNCSDTHECTTDSCDEDGNRCVHTPVNSRCVDSVMCTIDVCEVGQGCVHTPSDALCEDTVECTLHVCNASTGCEVSYNHTACADDDACTRDECTTTGCNHLTDYTLPGCVPPPTITGCFLNPMEICKAGEYCSTAASKCIACQGGSSPNAQKTACIADNAISCDKSASVCTGNLYCEPDSHRCAFCDTHTQPSADRTTCVKALSSETGAEDGLSVGAIVGIVIAVVVVLALIGGLLYYFLYYKPHHAYSLFENMESM